MKSKQVRTGSEKTWILVFDKGDEVVETLEEFAKRENLGASHFDAIGAFEDVVLGYFDWEMKDYRRLPRREQLEVLSLQGFIREGPDGPKVHAHAVLGRADGAAIGGHLLEGRVRPTLELVIRESEPHLARREDPETGLALVDLTEAPAGR